MLANDTDLDGDTLTAALVTNVIHGSLTLNANGGFTYTPSAGYSGPDSFTYRANDGTSNSNVATVSLTVTPVNHAPVANAGADQSATVGQRVQLSGSCTDVDGDSTTATWSFTAQPGTSTATLSSTSALNPTFTLDLAGSYVLRLVCNDTQVDSAPSTVTITVASSGTISVALMNTSVVGVGRTADLRITLSAPAPAGGVIVTLASDNTSVLGVTTATVTVPATQTQAIGTVNGVASGNTTLRASAAGYVQGTLNIGVTPNVVILGGPVNVPIEGSASLPISISPAAPTGGLLVTLSNSDANVATLAATTIAIPAGQAAGSVTVNGVGLGTASILAQAPGYASGLGTVTTAVPATLTVTNLNDSGAGSLRDAVAQANLGPGPNTIVFAPGLTGTIVLTTGQIRIDGPLTIVGPGRDVLAIDGSLNGRIFTIIENNAPACPPLSGPSDFLVSISGLTLQNGSRPVVDSGGGAIQTSKSLMLDAVTIRDSQAKGGGGLVFNAQYPGQILTINNSQFINNVAKPVVAGNTGSHNGGAVLVANYCPETRIAAAVTISESEFTGNRVQPVDLEGRGGAIAVYLATGFVTISDTRIVDNHVDPPNPPVVGFDYPGGGVQTTTKSVTIQRSEIAGNSQAPADAFAYLLANSTVSGNVANQAGGGVNVHANVTAMIANSTVNGNSAAINRTGGVRISSGPTVPASNINSTPPTLSIVSSIVANNSGADIGGLPSTYIPSPYTLNLTNSLVETALATDFVVTGTGNLVGVDPQLGALAFNGGPTRTHALQPGSPAIDTGSNPLALETDQRGTGFPRLSGAATDIGAFELAGNPLGVNIFASIPNSKEAGPVNGQFIVTRDNSNTAVSLRVFFTVGGTASNGVDYVFISSFVDIPVNQTSVTIPVTVNRDNLVEGNETVVLTLSASNTYSFGVSSAATVTIADQ